MKDLSIADLYAILNAAANNRKGVSKYPKTMIFVDAVKEELQSRLTILQDEAILKACKK